MTIASLEIRSRQAPGRGGDGRKDPHVGQMRLQARNEEDDKQRAPGGEEDAQSLVKLLRRVGGADGKSRRECRRKGKVVAAEGTKDAVREGIAAENLKDARQPRRAAAGEPEHADEEVRVLDAAGVHKEEGHHSVCDGQDGDAAAHTVSMVVQL